jgi:transglutaminase/protease-like cytokinesis protein 3
MPQVKSAGDSASRDYQEIDAHALGAPAALRTDLQALTSYLVEPARDDFEKARAIFVWITHNIDYDAASYFRGQLPRIGPDEALRKGKAVCFGYSGLFEAMARAAGLEVYSISGMSKGFSYQNRSRAGAISHAWNAVKLAGDWYLLDATWGAGYLDGQRKRFVRRFQPHYFLTPPDAFILDHLPDDPRWQLLKPRVTTKEFDALVFLRPAFFQNGLKLVSHTRGQIEVRGERLDVTLQVPEGSYLSARLLKGSQKLPREQVVIARQGVDVRVEVRFPGPGDYRLRVYTKRGTETREFDWALDYTVTVR